MCVSAADLHRLFTGVFVGALATRAHKKRLFGIWISGIFKFRVGLEILWSFQYFIKVFYLNATSLFKQPLKSTITSKLLLTQTLPKIHTKFHNLHTISLFFHWFSPQTPTKSPLNHCSESHLYNQNRPTDHWSIVFPQFTSRPKCPLFCLPIDLSDYRALKSLITINLRVFLLDWLLYTYYFKDPVFGMCIGHSVIRTEWSRSFHSVFSVRRQK